MNTKQFIHLPMVFLLLVLTGQTSLAQNESFSARFQEANRLEEEGEMNQAFMIWSQLAAENPQNGNVNYRAGRAYLSAPNQKRAALPFLELAIGLGISKNYDPISPNEKKSPVEVYYYLAKANHLNYKLDDAKEAYGKFIQEASSKHFLQKDALLGQQQVEHALALLKTPVEFSIENLGAVINSEFADFSPVISIDENALFFTSKRLRADSANYGIKDRVVGGYFEDIYASYKNRKGEWQEPELLDINTLDHTATINVSVDGQTLFLYQDDGGIGNIYESKLVGETWSTPIKMEGINTNNWETHLALSADEQTAYFVSNRNGGYGGRDIYFAKKLPNGNWGQAQNLGSNINTMYEEDAVFISPDELTMYFSSQGHNSMGGFDIFTTTRNDAGEWSKPKNIGYPINTVDDDVFFVTSADGKRAYYSSVRDSGYGEKDIYLIDLPEPQEVRLALLKGLIIPAESASLPDNMVITVINRGTRESTIFTPRQRDGSFVAILPPCYDYDVEYEIDGMIVARDTFSIECDLAYQEIYKELLLNPVQMGEDGTAWIVRDQTDEVAVVSSTGGSGKPATFKRYYGYNETNLAEEEQLFSEFMTNLKDVVDRKGRADISIEGSASKVPTETYGDNNKLANLRANGAKKRIIDNAKSKGINVNQLNFVKVEGKVQGPEYSGNARVSADEYRKFQYIDIIAK